jgi:ferric-dicitrate binding protein FerR (iron transport regulator)
LDSLIEKGFPAKENTAEEKLLYSFAKIDSNPEWDETIMGNKDVIHSSIKSAINNHIEKKRKQKTKHIIVYISSTAAILLLAISFWFLAEQNFQGNIFVADSVLLADGSIVYLSPNSVFSFPEKFGRDKRNVSLEKGNAFFKVSHNPQKPFVVVSGNIKTEVLGTSFNIHLCGESSSVKVHTGKVNVSSETEAVNILPCQEAVFSAKTNSIKVLPFDNNELIPWYNSDITLTNEKIETILKVVVQKYGLKKYTVEKEILGQEATVFIANGATLHSVLKQINFITNLKFYANEGTLTCKDKTG